MFLSNSIYAEMSTTAILVMIIINWNHLKNYAQNINNATHKILM